MGRKTSNEESIIFRVRFRKSYVFICTFNTEARVELGIWKVRFYTEVIVQTSCFAMRSRNSLGQDNLRLTPSSLSGSPVQFKSGFKAGLPVPASSRCLFLLPRHRHAQGMKPVQKEFLTVAAGHCWAPEPELWPLQSPARTSCTALRLGTWSTSQLRRWRRRAVTPAH